MNAFPRLLVACFLLFLPRSGIPVEEPEQRCFCYEALVISAVYVIHQETQEKKYLI